MPLLDVALQKSNGAGLGRANFGGPRSGPRWWLAIQKEGPLLRGLTRMVREGGASRERPS